MSWGFKPFEAITEPGTTMFQVIDAAHPEGVRPLSLRDDYDAAADLGLAESVPEGVRDYFDAIRMLWVYGWFYYPFYSLAAFHSGLCVEIALKKRFRAEQIRLPERPNLKFLLNEAMRHGWFIPEGFATIRRRKHRQDSWAEVDASTEGIPAEQLIDRDWQHRDLEAGMQRLLENVRYFRNRRAHPEGLLLLLPGMIYRELEFARDLIAQLFPSS